MNRRRFLQGTLAVPIVAGARGALFAQASPPPQTQTPTRDSAGRRIVIIGAGLAGLSVAHELTRENRGYDITILEARTRPGGRVYTMREPFSDGLYAEVGAGRIQDSHRFTLQYVKELELPLDPFFPTEGKNIVRIAGQRFEQPVGTLVDLKQVPLLFSDEEKSLGLGRSQMKYLFSHLSELGDPTAPGWPSKDLSRFERPILDFLQDQGASPGLQRMVALGHDLGGMSMLMLLRDAALAMETKVWYKIRGGNDRLPRAIAAKLSDRIRYGAAVMRIEQDANGVRAIYRQSGTGELVTVTGDYLVCALPLPVMRRVEVEPRLSAAKRAAIYEIDYMPMSRVFLQSRRRFWLERGDTGWAATDDPIDVWDYSRDQPGTRGILGAYTSGRMANKIAALDPAERGPFVLEMMERVHPGMREQLETSASHCWELDPWALGAAAEFKQGQLTAYLGALPTPEGRIHFAGEHTSPWNGWMNGGIESGQRVARELTARG